MELVGRRSARLRRGEEGHLQQGRSPRSAATCAPGHADGAADCGRGRTARLHVARAIAMVSQDVDGLVMQRRGVAPSQGPAHQQQSHQEQGEEPASWVRGSPYHHGAALTTLGQRKALPRATVVAGFTCCSPQSG
jgi:hypothetical protein